MPNEKSFLLLPTYVEKTVKPKNKYQLEPIVILVFFAWKFTLQIIPNQLLKQSCLFNGFNITECSTLSSNEASSEIEEKVQPEVAQVMMIITVLETFVPGVSGLFLLSWSDKFGRKIVIFGSLCGTAITLMVLSFLILLTDRNLKFDPWIYVLAFIPYGISGGTHVFLISTFCHLTDTVEETSRSTRFMIIQTLRFVGFFIGNLLCTYNFKFVSKASVTFCLSFSLVVASMFLMRSLIETSRSDITIDKTGGLISIKPIIEVVKTALQPRPMNERKILWCMFLVLFLSSFWKNGGDSVHYLYLREQFDWNLKEISIFESANSLIKIVSCVFSIYLFKRILNLSDTTLAMIAIANLTLDFLVKACSNSPEVVIIVTILSFAETLALPVYRSLVSSEIPKYEVGKVYSFIHVLESLSSLIASPLYAFVYTKTFIWWSASAFYLLSACCCVINFFLVIFVIKIER